MSGRTTLKTYFLTGATPTEANFSDLIDSVLVLSEDITSSLSTTSEVKALSASAGKLLNDSIVSIDSRVTVLENADNEFASNYYTKTEVDSNISSVSSQFNTLPYAGQISAIDTRVTSLEATGSSYASSVHSHGISEVTGLQDALDLKATIAFVRDIESSLVATINNLEVGDESAEVASLQSQVNSINTTISGLPTSSQLNAKADISHTHVVANISDINSEYYNKTQTDALLSSVKSTPSAHTHTESEITDLDKYTQGAVDLKLTDHNARTDNPHSVTKAQVSLGNVENLSVVDLFQTPQAQALAPKSDLLALEQTVSIHTADANNPHNVTKAQVSLGNVPNINFQSLLDAHINATNPHNINLSYFDVYSRAETDAQVQLYLDTLRYAFKPTAPTDGAGAVGDLAYHDTGMYFKFGPTDWRHILASKTFNDGSPGSSYEVETPKFDVTTPGGVNLFSVNNTTNTTNINTSLVSISNTLNVGGAVSLGQTLNVGGNVSLGSSLNVSNLFAVDKTTNTTNISTANVSIGGATNISNTLNVDGSVSLGSSLNVSNNLHVSNTQVSISTGLNVSNNVSIGGNVSISGAMSILGNLRATTLNDLTLQAPGPGKKVKIDDDLVVNNDVNIEGDNFTVGGATNLFEVNSSSTTIKTASTNIEGSVSIAGSTTLTSLQATGNVSIAGNMSATTNDLVLRAPASGKKVKVDDDLIVTGDLTVQGTNTVLNTQTLEVEDNIVLLNKNVTGTPTLDAGLEVERGTTANAKLFFQESTDSWKITVGSTTKTIAFVEDQYST